MISLRTSLSLVQYLGIHEYEFIKIILEKHGINHSESPYPQFVITAIKDSIKAASQDQIRALVGEIVQTENELRTKIQPRYKHDERFGDLERCLSLDGFNITNGNLIPQD